MTRKYSRQAWTAFLSASLALAVWVGLAWHGLSLFADSVVEGLGLEARSQYMLVLTIVPLFNTCTGLTSFGRLIELMGAGAVFLLGGLAATTGFVAMAFADDAIGLYVGAAIYGAAVSLVNANMVNYVLKCWFDLSLRGRLVGVANAFSSLCAIVFALVAPALIDALGWRATFLSIAGASLCAAIACSALYRWSACASLEDGLPEGALTVEPAEGRGGRRLHVAKDGERLAGRSWHLPNNDESFLMDTEDSAAGICFEQALRLPRFWVLAFSGVLLGMMGYGVMANLAPLAADCGFSDYAGMTLSIALALSFAAMVPLGWIADRYGGNAVVAFCLASLGCGCMILVLAPSSLASLFAAASFVGVAYDVVCVPVGRIVSEVLGERDFARKFGFLNSCVFGGCAVGPLAFAFACGAGGGSNAMVLAVVAVLSLASALLFSLAKA